MAAGGRGAAMAEDLVALFTAVHIDPKTAECVGPGQAPPAARRGRAGPAAAARG